VTALRKLRKGRWCIPAIFFFSAKIQLRADSSRFFKQKKRAQNKIALKFSDSPLLMKKPAYKC